MKIYKQTDTLPFIGNVSFLLLSVMMLTSFHTLKAQEKAQEYAARRERIYLHTDRDVYIPGEHLWFQIYCLDEKDQTFSDLSRLAYVELIHPDGHVVKRKKILLDQGLGAGELKIPEDLPTGIYSVFHYTHGMKSKAHAGVISSHLLIYNPESTSHPSASADSSRLQNGRDDSLITGLLQGDNRERDSSYDETQASRAIHIEGLKQVYGHRESVAVRLTGDGLLSGRKAHLSVAVSRVRGPDKDRPLYNGSGLVSTGSFVGTGMTVADEKQPEPGKRTGYCREKTGVLLSGSVSDQQGHPMKQRRILISFPDTVARIQLTHSDDRGRFQFFIYPDKPARDIVLSVLGYHGKAVFELKDKYLNEYPVVQTGNLSAMDNKMQGYLKDLYLTRRIIENYKQQIAGDYPPAEESPLWLNHPFYGKADEIVYFDDYQKLDSINEYFYEVVGSVQTTREGLRIINTNNQLLNGDPAYLIDGVFYENHLWMTRMVPDQCKSLEVIRSPFLVQDTLFQGVVSLYTQSGDLPFERMPGQSTRLNYRLYHPSSRFARPGELQDHLPYFRNTLFWKPGISLAQGRPVNIKFDTPDNQAWYKLEIFGFIDGGRPLLKRKYFFVGKR